jgi:hypothetical protein
MKRVSAVMPVPGEPDVPHEGKIVGFREDIHFGGNPSVISDDLNMRAQQRARGIFAPRNACSSKESERT